MEVNVSIGAIIHLVIIIMHLIIIICILFIKLIIMKIIFRWDCEESSQIWASCSDVKIKAKI